MSFKDSNTEEQLRWNFPRYYRLDSLLSNTVLIRCNYFKYHTFFYQWLVGKSTPDSLHSFANASGNRHANKYRKELHTLSWGVSGTRRIWWGDGWVLGANASSSFDFRFHLLLLTTVNWWLMHYFISLPHPAIVIEKVLSYTIPLSSTYFPNFPLTEIFLAFF